MNKEQLNKKIKSFTSLLVEEILKKEIDAKAVKEIANIRRSYIKKSLTLTAIDEIIETLSDIEELLLEKSLKSELREILIDDKVILDKELDKRYETNR